jgi:hypothetical protein
MPKAEMAMNNEPGWLSLNDRCDSYAKFDCTSMSVKAILLTSFDAVDAKLLVDHLLPHWFNVSRGSVGEGPEQVPFILELCDALRSANKLVVISSVHHEGGTAYPWLWRYLRPATVGRDAPAVQHAKLWMFLREGRDSTGRLRELLEICVSSTNLTSDACKNQIQAAWRCVLELNPQSSTSHRRSWGILPAFIRALASSCGPNRKPEIEYFADLLDRADCPDWVSFLASVPGEFSPSQLERAPWGIAGLGTVGIDQPKVTVVTPTVGAWSAKGLASWTDAITSTPKYLSLACAPKDLSQTHDGWKHGWSLPEETAVAVEDGGGSLVTFQTHRNGPNPLFHDRHVAGDLRWLHAKFYEFSRGTTHKLLLTSANFTTSAWGFVQKRGGLRIVNFELGVLLRGVRLPFDVVGITRDEIHFNDKAAEEIEGASFWAEVEWDGEVLTFSFAANRTSSVPQGVFIHWVSNGARHLDDLRDLPVSGHIEWRDTGRIPIEAELTFEDIPSLLRPVLDVRPLALVDRSPLPILGIDDEAQERWRDAILLEKYGGNVASESSSGVMLEEEAGFKSEASADYSIRAFVKYREWCAVIDNWQRRHDSGDGLCVRDASVLLYIFDRQSQDAQDLGTKVASKLAEEELKRRLDFALSQRQSP